jgi:hypothetical protein
VSRILLEDTFQFKPDRARISESKDPVTGALLAKTLPGTLSVCDCINGNRRRYAKRVWEKNLSPGSVLSQMFERNASFGLLEHPADGKVDLRSPISHLTTEARLVEKEIGGQKMWVVEGTIKLLNTVEGMKLAALIEAGYDPLVSSRGYGSLVKAPDGIDEVQEDFVCEGWDVVSTPSFVQAQLTPQRAKSTTESKIPNVGESYNGLLILASKMLADKKSVELTLEDGSPIILTQESKTPATPVSAPTPSSVKANQQPTSHHIMDIKAIRESIQSLKSLNPAALDARNFALGFQQMSELHNAAAKVLAENASASWEVNVVHKELSTLEETWATAFEAPKAEVRKLNENQTKLLKVLKGVTAHSVKVRESLSLTTKKGVKSTEIAEALAKRGRAWMEAAKTELGQRRLIEKKYGVATEALDIMAGRYKGDVSEIASHVLKLEFPSMTEDHKKSLAEAKTPQAVLAVRKTLEEAFKPAADAPKTEKVEEGKKADAPKTEKVEEGKKAETPAPAKVEESKKDEPKVEEPVILRCDSAVVGVNESIDMVRRLSKGNSQFHS